MTPPSTRRQGQIEPPTRQAERRPSPVPNTPPAPVRRITPSSTSTQPSKPSAATSTSGRKESVNERNARIKREIDKIIDRPMTKHGEIEIIPTVKPDGSISFEWTYQGPGGEERAKELEALFKR